MLNRTVLNIILQNSNTSAVFFNADKKLEFISDGVRDLWRIGNLPDNIGVIDFFEHIMEKNVYPQLDDFKDFCNSLHSYFVHEGLNISKLLLISNNTHIEQKIISLDRGLLFTWQDVTDRQELYYGLNLQKNSLARVINQINIATLQIASTGRVSNFNVLFASSFGIDISLLEDYPHISELLASFNLDSDINQLVIDLLNKKSHNALIKNKLGEQISINSFALPNNSIVVTFNHITDDNTLEIIPEQFISSINRNHNSMLDTLGRAILSPLNSVIGFSDILANGYVGELNDRQKDLIEKIFVAANDIYTYVSEQVDLLVYNQDQSVSTNSVDLHEVGFEVNRRIKFISAKQHTNLNIDLGFEDSVVLSNQSLLVKLISLILSYIMKKEDNLIVRMSIKNPPFRIVIEDNSGKVLFSREEEANSFEVILIEHLLKLLKAKYQMTRAPKSFRIITINFD